MAQVKNRQITDKKSILIVDDDPDTCQLLAAQFGGKGYDASIVYTGQEALKWMETGEADLIVLDIMMPEMDGWETYNHIRSRSDIPVLFLSAITSGDSAVRALELGASDYVKKPFHSRELLSRAEVAIKRADPRRTYLYPLRRIRPSYIRPTVSIVIPTLNEAENLPLVLPYLPFDWIDEVILIDGLSTDGTVEVAEELLPSIKVVHEKRPGKGIALRTGYEAATSDIIVSMDADGSNDPREIPRFVEALMQGADFAKGSRFAPGGGTTDMPRYRKLGNLFFVSLTNILFNGTFTDLCYGYNAFWRHCLSTFDHVYADGFEIETAIYTRALRERLKIAEVPSFEGYRFRGVGKLKTIPDGLRVFRTIIHEWLGSMNSSNRSVYIGYRGKPPQLLKFNK
jgi:CheY-like chemotaxis protein